MAVAKTKHNESLTPTPHLLSTGLGALMFNLKENIGELQLEGKEIEIIRSTSTLSILKSSVIFNDF